MNDQTRILSILFRLQSGAQLSKKQLAEEFEISEKSIQRDFSLLSRFIEEHPVMGAELIYDGSARTRKLVERSLFNKKDILILTKILLESRALNKEELDSLLKGLLALVDKSEQDEIRAIIGSEWMNYASLADKKARIDKIWQLSEYIRQEQLLKVEYENSYYHTKKNFKILPVALYFDNFYFYLVAYQPFYKKNINLRVDKISQMTELEAEKLEISYGQKYQDGDERKYKADAMSGFKKTIRIEFYSDPDIVLDRFPESKVLEREAGKSLIEITAQETYGLERWMMGQGTMLKVLSPQSLAKTMRERYEEILKYYKE